MRQSDNEPNVRKKKKRRNVYRVGGPLRTRKK
jgi:hypothetical protein